MYKINIKEKESQIYKGDARKEANKQSIKFEFIFLFSAIKSNSISIQMPDNIRNQNQVSGIYA